MDLNPPPGRPGGHRGNDTTPAGRNVSPASPRPRWPHLLAAPARQRAVRSQIKAEIATVPEPQRPMPAMLPGQPPAGLDLGKLGERHLETFNADNLSRRSDGAAEASSTTEASAVGLRRLSPDGRRLGRCAGLDLFEMGNTSKALGQVRRGEPEELKLLPIGSEGYARGRECTDFYSGPTTPGPGDERDRQVADFALELAGGFAREAGAKPERRSHRQSHPKMSPPKERGKEKAMEKAPDQGAARGLVCPAPPPEPWQGRAEVRGAGPRLAIASCPTSHGRLSQGRHHLAGLPPPLPRRPRRPKRVFNKYLDGAKMDGADIKSVEAEGADRMINSANIGPDDVLFLKGNVTGAPTGQPICLLWDVDEIPAEAFARAFVKSLPAEVTAIETESQGSDRPASLP